MSRPKSAAWVIQRVDKRAAGLGPNDVALAMVVHSHLTAARPMWGLTLDQLAAEVGLSRRTTWAVTMSLRSRGLLLVRQGHQHLPSQYGLPLEAWEALPKLKAQSSSANVCTPEPVSSSANVCTPEDASKLLSEVQTVQSSSANVCTLPSPSPFPIEIREERSLVHEAQAGGQVAVRTEPVKLAPLLLSGIDTPPLVTERPRRTRKGSTYTTEQTADAKAIVEAWTTAYALMNAGLEPGTVEGPQWSSAHKLRARYGRDEAVAIVRRGVTDGCRLLTAIASQADRFRGPPAARKTTAGAVKQSDVSWGIRIGEEVWRKPKSEGGGLQ